MPKRLITSILGLAVGIFSAASQIRTDTVYHTTWDIDAPILATGIGANATSIGHPASDLASGAAALLPLTLMADKGIREQALNLSVLFSETALVTNGLALATQRIAWRDRPSPAPLEMKPGSKLAAESLLPFYAGHTAMTASMSFFTAKVWSDYHPHSPWKPVVWSAAATLPVVSGYLRNKGTDGQYFRQEMATGYLVGALVGYFVPHFHKVDRRAKRRYRVSSTFVDGVPLLTFKCRV